MWVFLIIYAISLFLFAIHVLSLRPEERTKSKVIELLLLYQLIFSVGVTSFIAFIGLTFLGHEVDKVTNWPRCPYQQELANVNLA